MVLAGAGMLLAVLFLLLLLSVFRRRRKKEQWGVWPADGQRDGDKRQKTRDKKQKSAKKSGQMTGDTADMPVVSMVYLEHYGFRVVEDITYIHTENRITQEETENGMDDR